MAEKLNPKKIAIGLGAFLAVMDFIWVLIVASGYAPAMVGWKLGMFFLSSSALTVTAFNPVTAVESIVACFIGGAVWGWIFAVVWNYAAKFK